MTAVTGTTRLHGPGVHTAAELLTYVEANITPDVGNVSPANIASLFTRGELEAATVPAAFDAIRTTGFASAGDRGEGLYVRTGSSHNVAEASFQSGDGAWWTYAPDSRGVNVKAFGALGDNSNDDWRAIQSAVDYALEENLVRVYVPAGIYKTSDCIHLGYGRDVSGNNFNTIQLFGDGSYAASTSYGGGRSWIAPTFKDRPVINIQAGRNSGVQSIYIKGPTTISDPGTMTLAQRADASNYVPSSADNSTNSPYCGICIDAYSGSSVDVPADAYPDPVYPSFVSTPAEPYGRPYTSDFFIRDCLIQYTNFGILVQPNQYGGADQNGDFGHFEDTRIEFCQYGVYVPNSQARSINYTNMNFYGCWTCIAATGGPGHGVGNVSGAWKNIHVNASYQIIKLVGGWSHPLHVDGMYMELGMRLGDFTAQEIIFRSSSFEFGQHSQSTSEQRVEPVFTCGTAYFEACRIIAFQTAMHVKGDAYFSKDCSFTRDVRTPPTGVELAACNKLFNVLIDEAVGPSCDPTQRISVIRDTSSVSYFWSNGFRAHNAQYDYSPGFGALTPVRKLANFVSCNSPTWGTQGTANGRTCTVTSSGQARVGDVIYSSGHNWFVVTAVVSSDLTLVALTNFTKDASGNYTMLDTSFHGGGANILLPMDVFDLIPQSEDVFLKTTSGSSTVEIVDGTGSAVSAVPSGLDTSSLPLWTAVNPKYYANSLPFPTYTTISSINSGAKTFAMSANALVSGTWAYAPGIARIK